MKPAHDTLYQIHQLQAQTRGEPALPYEEFCARLYERGEPDLTGLMLPPPTLVIARQINRQKMFDLGRLCISTKAGKKISAEEVLRAIARHAAADWGSLDQHSWRHNNRALRKGERILSAYETATGCKFWVVTEFDRSVTTVMLPDEL